MTVQGMHCQACTSLISMELEEQGLSNLVKEIQILENNVGEVHLDETISEADLQKVKNSINKMDNYSVV